MSVFFDGETTFIGGMSAFRDFIGGMSAFRETRHIVSLAISGMSAFHETHLITGLAKDGKDRGLTL